MKKLLIIVCFSLVGCSPYVQTLKLSSCTSDENQLPEQIQSVLDELTAVGIPGVALAVYSEKHGWSEGASGLSKIETGELMQSCQFQYLQSISKTYLAVATLKLVEEKRLDLDAPFVSYLKGFENKIPGAKNITIRMLLNHTSGIREYNSEPLYVTRLLQNPEKNFAPEDYIEFIAGKEPSFQPGSRYSYRNTNYVVLAMVLDQITGDHVKYLHDNILKPVGLSETFYHRPKGDLLYERIPNTYWDRYSNSILENISTLQRNNVAALIGDDGVIATPENAVMFLKALLEGKIISKESLSAMQQWVNDRTGTATYGLGLDRATIAGKDAIGHSGGGLGSGCQLYFFPEYNTYIFVAINLGTVTDSPIHKRAETILEKFYTAYLSH